VNFETLKVSIEDGIALVMLNRPPVNAQNAKMRTELTEAFDRFNDNPETRARLQGTMKMMETNVDYGEIAAALAA